MCFSLIAEQDARITRRGYRARFNGNINDHNQQRTPQRIVADASWFSERYQTRILKASIFPGMSDVIQTLATSHSIEVVSSSEGNAIRQFLRSHDLEKYVDEIFGNEISRSKVEKLKMVIGKHGGAAHRYLFITDTIGDIREGEMVGIPTIAVTWGYQDEQILASGNPTAIVRDPVSLLQAVARMLDDKASDSN